MSDLQLALVGVAVLALLGLYANGKWQERRLLRRMRQRLHGGVGDALLQTEGAALPARSAAVASARRDPNFPQTVPAVPAEGARAQAAAFLAQAGAQDEADEAREQGAAPGAAAVTSEALRTPTVLLQPNWAEDPLLDCSLEMRFTRAVDGVSVIEAAALLARTPWRLPVHFVVWDGRHQQWVLPDRFGYYTEAVAAIQLADRRTRLEEDEIARFVHAVQQVAAALDADVDAPDAGRLLEQAQELDRLCARFDIKIGLTVRSAGAAWTGPQLRTCAQEGGFTATSPQSWERLSARGERLFTLQADPAHLDRLALELDIAVAPVEAQSFARMVQSAFDLAQALGGRVVDDNGQPIDARSTQAIEAQLARVFEEMRAAGIKPGSARARRLYV